MSSLEDLEQQNEGTSLLSESKTQAEVADYHSHRVNDSIPADAHHREQHQQLVDDHANGDEPDSDEEKLSVLTISCILSTAFCYGCIFTTLFLITLPIECRRIHHSHPEIQSSIALGEFVAIAGFTQLISPFIGRLSDTYVPPVPHDLGQRLPYLVLGSLITCAGLVGQMLASFYGFWIRYSIFFFLHMIGLNIVYAMMISLIPDQVPHSQTGVANGILAFLLVTGSLFGFGLFHSVLGESIQNMYALYTVLVIVATILTGTHAADKDAEIAYRRQHMGDRADVMEDYKQQQSALSASTPMEHNLPQWKSNAKKAAKRAQKIVVVTPTLILRSMLVDPIRKLNWRSLLQSYTIDTEKYHDFFIVTVSRLFYYCGMSVQTFFLYFVHDIIGKTKDPEHVVAAVAILGQISGALTCYPVGFISDAFLNGRRKPFVYVACALLGGVTISLIFARTLHQMTILALILGGANGVYLTMDTSLAVDTLPTIRSVGRDASNGESAQLLGIWGVAAFLGSALGPMIGGPLLYIFGHETENDGPVEDDEQQEYSIRGYTVVLSLSSFYFFCSAISLRFIRDHRE